MLFWGLNKIMKWSVLEESLAHSQWLINVCYFHLLLCGRDYCDHTHFRDEVIKAQHVKGFAHGKGKSAPSSTFWFFKAQSWIKCNPSWIYTGCSEYMFSKMVLCVISDDRSQKVIASRWEGGSRDTEQDWPEGVQGNSLEWWNVLSLASLKQMELNT